ncbi:hypothetical protein BKK56_00670 [Rodentibacter genomosp. 2]|nr:hypothetical protein BKK56_00670 [Rodentibacter genomosp. 2]
MAKCKKLLIFIPLFLMVLVVLFLYFHFILTEEIVNPAEAHIGYVLGLLWLTFPLGYPALVIFSFLLTDFFDPIAVELMGIVAIIAFYFQWYVLCPKLWRYFCKKLKRNKK